MITSLLKPDNWEIMTDAEKFESISIRMDMMYAYSKRKSLRQRYASSEQFAEEYSKENEVAVLVGFIEIRKEYEEIRDYILKNKEEKFNMNAEVLEDMLVKDIESALLGANNE